MAKRVHVAGIFVSCMSSVPCVFVRTPNSRAVLTIHAKLFTFTRVRRVHARVHTHACVKFKVSSTVNTSSDPFLVACCGYNFCDSCLECYLQSKVIDHGAVAVLTVTKNCFRVYQIRELNVMCSILKVFCPQKYQGCTWVGELRSVGGHVMRRSMGDDHVNENSIGCPFTELQWV